MIELAEVLDSFFGLLSPGQWESLRNWLATIGGLIALSIAANTYRRNGRLKREEQARLVYSRISRLSAWAPGEIFPLLEEGAETGGLEGPIDLVHDYKEGETWARGKGPLMQSFVVIHNGSKELIGPARVQMTFSNGEIIARPAVEVDAIEPETDCVVSLTWENPFYPAQPTLGTTVLFRDASAIWWRRRQTDPVERVHDDPANPVAAYKPVGMPAVWFGISSGAPGTPVPNVPLRAKWHRFLRRMRGLTPTP